MKPKKRPPVIRHNWIYLGDGVYQCKYCLIIRNGHSDYVDDENSPLLNYNIRFCQKDNISEASEVRRKIKEQTDKLKELEKQINTHSLSVKELEINTKILAKVIRELKVKRNAVSYVLKKLKSD